MLLRIILSFINLNLEDLRLIPNSLKSDPNSTFDIEKYAQAQMPKHAISNLDAKLTYLNGRFGYFLKCILCTNALGLIRDVNFFNSDNVIDKDLSPQDIKDSFDAKSLIPALETHSNFILFFL